mgnify:FL=1
MDFNSLKDLRNRLEIAMTTKVNELKDNGITYITNDDIWNYLTSTKWKNAKGLTLSDMVDDILKIQIK